MKNLTLTTLLVLVALLSPQALAKKVKCEPAKFERLYQRGDTVYVRIEGQPWHKLGIEGDNDLDKKINRLRKAERKGWYVQLVFPNGYEDDTCRTSNPDYAVKKVKLKKSYDGEEMEPEEDDGDTD